MVLFKSLNLILWITLLGFCHAKVEDYLKGIQFPRTFNSIEGKVIDVRITMSDEQYNEMIEGAQLSPMELLTIYNRFYPDELKYTTNVSVSINVGDDVYTYENVKFKLGGSSSKVHAKVGFNLKLKEPFFGRKNLHLRPRYGDVTHMRSKIAIDLVNKWNIPTVQETFVHAYINDKYFGFYSFLDAIKPSWAKDFYDLPENSEVKTLYVCEGLSNAFNPTTVRNICKNEKNEYLNYTQPLYDMVDAVYESKNLKQLQKKFDNIENMRKIFIYEYLFSSTDNFLITGNNYDFYQKPNGKWEFIPNDFDLLFLQEFQVLSQVSNFDIPKKDNLTEYAKAPFEEWHSSETRKPFIDILYYKDQQKFKKTLKKLLITGFNPDELFPRIDELAQFMAPHLERDLTPDENGNLPGRINLKGVPNGYTMEDFWNSLGFEEIKGDLGLKQFIQTKFDAVCDNFKLNKKQILEQAKIYRKLREVEIQLYDLNQKLMEQASNSPLWTLIKTQMNPLNILKTKYENQLKDDLN